MSGSAGSIMSIASGFSAMIEAITTTNSGKPIGRWFDDTKSSALISAKVKYLAANTALIDYAAMHKWGTWMAAPHKWDALAVVGGAWGRAYRVGNEDRAVPVISNSRSLHVAHLDSGHTR